MGNTGFPLRFQLELFVIGGMEMAVCAQSKVSFQVAELEGLLLEKFGLPEPTRMPSLRLQHRLTFRNERTLYKRKSSLSNKPIISIYASDTPYQVYANEEWWSDKWDGLEYGREFDFNRPFFEQFAELQLQVPRIALFNVNPYNSDYCQQAYDCKNSYLCMVVKDCEDSCYVSHSNRVTDSFDCDYVQNVELSYDCMDSDRLYACIGSDHCQNSHELLFCIDCIGSSNCIGCWGLRNQKYQIFNKQYSKEEYEKQRAALRLGTRQGWQKWSAKIRAEVEKRNTRSEFNINTEDCEGSNLINAQNCQDCHDSFEIQECAHCTWIFESHHCAGIYGMGTSEWVYESVGVENLNFGAFCTFVSDSGYALYSDLCFHSQDIFGCIGLKRKKHCILNKEYSPQEYEKLRDAIVEHMKKTGEWGQFFPASLSPFAYNESVALERFPLPKAEAEGLGYRWREADPKEYQAQAIVVPDDIAQVGDEISKDLLACEQSGKNFRITAQELKFYRTMGLPIPSLCPDARYAERMKRRA